MQPDICDQATLFPLSLERLVRRYLRKRLRLFKVGSIRVELPSGQSIEHRGIQAGPLAVIVIKRWRLFFKLLLEGEIGLARSYVDNDWSTPDLTSVLDFGIRNLTSLSATTTGLGIGHYLNRVLHHRNANTEAGSRRNIAAHYDLGNDFYALWLDKELTYSSALFSNVHQELEDAQQCKLERVIELLDLTGEDNVLEIGCGWGSLARRIAALGAGNVTGISLSGEQVAYARNRIGGGSTSDNIHFELLDYRNITQRYERIVSIEMLEAVGEQYWPTYFDKLRQALTADGVVVLQVITIAEGLFASYRRRPDYIQQYIFPGGMLPTVAIVKAEAERAGFRIDHYEPFGQSYAQTLEIWQERFNGAWPDIQRLDFDDRFRRMWNYYLSYCSAGFRRGSIDVGLFKLSPNNNSSFSS